jgi:hypothetical protein
MNLLNILNKFGNYLLQEIIKILIVLLIPILITNYYYSSAMGYIIYALITLNGLYMFPHLIEKTNMFVSYINTYTYLINYINSLASLISLINFSIAIVLGIILLFIEIKERKQSILKESKNININNDLDKTIIKLLDIIPLILAIIVASSLLLLIIFPANITLISIIIIMPSIYILTLMLIKYLKDTKANINIEAIEEIRNKS